MKRLLQTGTRLTLWLGLGLLVTAGVTIGAVNLMQRRQALDEAQARAERILDRNLALHSYLNQVLKPRVFAVTDQCVEKLAFDPTWMSSTHVVREVDKIAKSRGTTRDAVDYYYKECAIDARSPENEADPFERDFLLRLNRDPTLLEESTTRRIDGQPFFVIMRRGETMESSCLRCHSSPGTAPPGLTARYGATRSFGRHLGETVSAISIRIPLTGAYAAANHISLQLSLLLVGALLLLTALQIALWRRLLLGPLLAVRDRALLIARDPEQLGATIPHAPHAGRELVELVGAFNLMSLQLREGHDRLEERVRQRTAELESKIDECSIVEREMRDSLELKRAMLENAPVGILIYREDGSALRVNEAAARIVGAERAILEGQNYLHLDSWRKSGLLDLARTALRENRSVARDIHIVTSFGREGWWETVCTPVESGGDRHLLLLVNDISERVRMQEVLLQHEKSHSVASLASGVAHEINNPLAIIAQSAQNLSQRLAPDLPVNQSAAAECGLDWSALACYRQARRLDLFLSAITDAAQRAAAIVGVLGTFAERQGGTRRTIALDELLDEALKLTASETLATTLGFTVERDYAADLPLFTGVEQELVQVFCALLTNAMQAMTLNPPQRPPRLTLRLRHAARHLVIDVEDNGPGMVEEIRRRVFEPFFTTKDPTKSGRGLSLWACYMIVTRNYDGRIEVASTPDVVTRFTVVLPVTRGSEVSNE